MSVILHQGDCLEVMKTLVDNSLDSIVTDPPYGLSFMGKKWDHDVPSVDIWTEALRVLKPGGHLLSFSGTRTYHRMVVAIEDAGFEIRDQIGWVFGSGFPKSVNISKAIDAKIRKRDMGVDYRPHELAGTENYGVGRMSRGADTDRDYNDVEDILSPEATEWEGYGTALKPAWEPIVVARKPIEKTIADNVLKYGVGGLNIDACRVPVDLDANASQLRTMKRNVRADDSSGQTWGMSKTESDTPEVISSKGRFPANIIHDGSDEVLDAFAKFGVSTSGAMKRTVEAYEGNNVTGFLRGRSGPNNQHGGTGTAARFFYAAKASKKERNGSNHPTVKPVSLMEYLVKLVTPKNGTVLDPFAGSGTTGQAAADCGFNAILIEREEEYCNDIRKRLALYIE